MGEDRGGSLIRQDLEPILYESFVTFWPGWLHPTWKEREAQAIERRRLRHWPRLARRSLSRLVWAARYRLAHALYPFEED